MKPSFAIKDRNDGHVVGVYEGDFAELNARERAATLNRLLHTHDYIVIPWVSGSTND